MFSSRLGSQTPFFYTENGNDKAIYKIAWDSNYDSVFNVVVRALLFDRVPDDSNFRISYNEVTHNADMYDSPYEELHRRLLALDGDPKTAEYDLWLIAMKRTDSSWFDKLSEEVKEKSPTWIETVKVRKFFSRTEVTCFTQGKKTIVIYRPLENMGLETERYVLMGTPVYIPWFFKEKPITKEETEFLECLSKTNVEPFLKAVGVLYALKDVSRRKMEAELTGIESRYARSKLEYTKQEVDNLTARIASKRDEISSLLTKIRDYNLLIDGLRNVLKADNNDVLEYFKANKNLVYKECNGDSVTFYATGYLDVFDADMAEEFVDNYDSIIYEYTHQSRQDTENLFRAIFVDQTVKLKSVAMYTVRIGEFRVNGIADATYTEEVKQFFPNTHIDRYHCLGDYEMMMVDALKGGDIIGCLSLCGMSAHSLNFGDSTVMEEFVSRLTRTCLSCFEYNGNDYKLQEILEELRKEDK